MSRFPLRRLSLAFFSALRRLHAHGAAWVAARPRVASWILPAPAAAAEQPAVGANDADEESYRDFNRHYFASFYEQERMLADQPRMAFYHEAIARHIKPGATVIDLGTGTGILAAFASRRGAARVYAIDHSEILEHARAVAAHNRIERVEFVNTHSRDFTPAGKVDVILHEQMGDALFDEGMVANIADLRERALKPGGLILPSRFELFIEPVQIRDGHFVPFIWDMEVHGVDYGCLAKNRPEDPGYYHLRSCDRSYVNYFLGEPVPLLAVDLHTLKPEDLPREVHFTREVTRAGHLHGHVIFFRAHVDADLTLSSSPLDPGRAPHWGFRILRAGADAFAVGDRIDVHLAIDDWTNLESWRWRHERQTTTHVPPPAAPG